MQREYAYFTARGTGNLSAVTDAIGIQPSQSHRADDINPTTGTKYGVTEWRLESGEPDSTPLSQHIDVLLLWLNRRPVALREMVGDFDLTIHCVAYQSSCNLGLYLTPTQTQQLGRLGIAIDFDGYADLESSDS